MIHTEETIARAVPEPENGGRLVVDNGGGDWRVIWRDDAEARRWPYAHEEERWFRDTDSHPMALYQHLQYAQAVYVLGEPVVVFQ